MRVFVSVQKLVRSARPFSPQRHRRLLRTTTLVLREKMAGRKNSYGHFLSPCVCSRNAKGKLVPSSTKFGHCNRQADNYYWCQTSKLRRLFLWSNRAPAPTPLNNVFVFSKFAFALLFVAVFPLQKGAGGGSGGGGEQRLARKLAKIPPLYKASILLFLPISCRRNKAYCIKSKRTNSEDIQGH